MRVGWFRPLLTVSLLALSGLALAQGAANTYVPGQANPMTSTEMPKELEGVGIDEHLGANVDLSMPVKDELGNIVPLSTYFKGDHPVILSLVYFSCPHLCNFHLNGLAEGMKNLAWVPGQQFEVVSLSIDPKETPQLAGRKKDSYVHLLGKPEAAQGWHFLTADQPVIDQLSKTTGFKFKWNEQAKDWMHASAAIVMTPQGKISRYLPGIDFQAQDLKLALLEASNGKIGTTADKLIMFCYQYDSHTSKYSIMVFRLMQLGGALIILVLAMVLVPFWWRSRKEPKIVKA
jgi:protein SCO1/2